MYLSAPLSWALFYRFICMTEKVNFGYSTKNIPIPSEKTYLLQLMEKVELVITRMRRRAIHFNNSDSIDNKKEENTKWYGLISPCSLRQMKELIPFQNNSVELIRNINFRKIRNTFQKKLKEDIKLIKDSNKTMTSADKTSNMYRLTKGQYYQLIMNSIISTYIKANNKIKKQLNITGENLLRAKKAIKRTETNENFDNHSPTNQSCLKWRRGSKIGQNQQVSLIGQNQQTQSKIGAESMKKYRRSNWMV